MNQKETHSEIVHPWIAAEAAGDPTLTRLFVLQDGIYAEAANPNLTRIPEEFEERTAAMDALRTAIGNRQRELGINPIEFPSTPRAVDDK